MRCIERILKSGLLPISELESCFDSIEVSQKAVDRCAALADAECETLLPPPFVFVLLIEHRSAR
jgi:hypothetical protein